MRERGERKRVRERKEEESGRQNVRDQE